MVGVMAQHVKRLECVRGHDARASMAHQAPLLKAVTHRQVAAAAQTAAGSRDTRPRPGAVLTVGEAREGERREPFACADVLKRPRRCDRAGLTAEHQPVPRGLARLLYRFEIER